MIVSFGDRATEDLYHGRPTSKSRQFPHHVAKSALVKLDMLDAAQRLLDVASPPGNRLEVLKGAYRGLLSIRVNQQWRIVFRWEDDSAYEVQLVDYHD